METFGTIWAESRRNLHRVTFIFSIYLSFVTRKILFKFEAKSVLFFFFSRWLERARIVVGTVSTFLGHHRKLHRVTGALVPCIFFPRVVPLFSNGSSSSRFYLSSSFFLPPSLPLLFDPSHYGSFCARMNAAVHRRFHDNGTGHSERHKYWNRKESKRIVDPPRD